MIQNLNPLPEIVDRVSHTSVSLQKSALMAQREILDLVKISSEFNFAVSNFILTGFKVAHSSMGFEKIRLLPSNDTPLRKKMSKVRTRTGGSKILGKGSASNVLPDQEDNKNLGATNKEGEVFLEQSSLQDSLDLVRTAQFVNTSSRAFFEKAGEFNERITKHLLSSVTFHTIYPNSSSRPSIESLAKSFPPARKSPKLMPGRLTDSLDEILQAQEKHRGSQLPKQNNENHNKREQREHISKDKKTSRDVLDYPESKKETTRKEFEPLPVRSESEETPRMASSLKDKSSSPQIGSSTAAQDVAVFPNVSELLRNTISSKFTKRGRALQKPLDYKNLPIVLLSNIMDAANLSFSDLNLPRASLPSATNGLFLNDKALIPTMPAKTLYHNLGRNMFPDDRIQTKRDQIELGQNDESAKVSHPAALSPRLITNKGETKGEPPIDESRFSEQIHPIPESAVPIAKQLGRKVTSEEDKVLLENESGLLQDGSDKTDDNQGRLEKRAVQTIAELPTMIKSSVEKILGAGELEAVSSGFVFDFQNRAGVIANPLFANNPFPTWLGGVNATRPSSVMFYPLHGYQKTESLTKPEESNLRKEQASTRILIPDNKNTEIFLGEDNKETQSEQVVTRNNLADVIVQLTKLGNIPNPILKEILSYHSIHAASMHRTIPVGKRKDSSPDDLDTQYRPNGEKSSYKSYTQRQIDRSQPSTPSKSIVEKESIVSYLEKQSSEFMYLPDAFLVGTIPSAFLSTQIAVQARDTLLNGVKSIGQSSAFGDALKPVSFLPEIVANAYTVISPGGKRQSASMQGTPRNVARVSKSNIESTDNRLNPDSSLEAIESPEVKNSEVYDQIEEEIQKITDEQSDAKTRHRKVNALTANLTENHMIQNTTSFLWQAYSKFPFRDLRSSKKDGGLMLLTNRIRLAAPSLWTAHLNKTKKNLYWQKLRDGSIELPSVSQLITLMDQIVEMSGGMNSASVTALSSQGYSMPFIPSASVLRRNRTASPAKSSSSFKNETSPVGDSSYKPVEGGRNGTMRLGDRGMTLYGLNRVGDSRSFQEDEESSLRNLRKKIERIMNEELKKYGFKI